MLKTQANYRANLTCWTKKNKENEENKVNQKEKTNMNTFLHSPFKSFFPALISIISLSILLLSGCTTAGKNVLPKGGDMSMAKIYQQETGLSANSRGEYDHQDVAYARRKIHTNKRYSHYQAPKSVKTRYATYAAATSSKHRDPEFKPLPNPMVPMYVYPHLVDSSGGAQPIPSYSTAFFLYRENHFSMPSEEY